MIERGVKMKIAVLIVLFVLNIADANRDEFRRGFDPRNDVERPIFPFEAFNMGFENFLRKIHPPLLAAMNGYGQSEESTQKDASDEFETDNPSASSNSEHDSRKDIPENIESKDQSSSMTSESSSSAASRSRSKLESKTESDSEDFISASILAALDRESSHSTVDLSELSVADRQSPMGVQADRPYTESRSRHDSLEFVEKEGENPAETIESSVVGSGEPQSQTASEAERSGTRGPESLAVGSGGPEGTVELYESESFIGSGVASTVESFLRAEEDLDTASGGNFEDVPIEEACYNEGLVAGLGDYEDKMLQDEEPPKDVRKWEKVRQELSVANVRKRLGEAVSELQDIKKRSMKRGESVLGDLNHVIADLEFLCDTICEEVPKEYLSSASISF